MRHSDVRYSFRKDRSFAIKAKSKERDGVV